MRIPEGFTTLLPYLVVADGEAYIHFLVTALGGVETGRHMDGGRLAHAQVRFGDTTIMLGEAQDNYPPTRQHLYLFVENADEAFARALAHGGKLHSVVEDKPYGDRHGGVEDPEGNVWWLSQRLTDEPYF